MAGGWKNDSRGEIDNHVGKIESIGGETASEVNRQMGREEGTEKLAPEVSVEHSTKRMPTLPQKFKSLVGRPISIADKEPRNLIAMLGRCLGVEDYETNMAAFWFVDFIALQVLRSENILDDLGRSVMVSWLAGEMQLIREKRLSHEEFWRRIRDIFAYSDENVSRGRALRHWELAAEESNAEEIIVEEKAPEEPKEAEVTRPKLMGPRTTSKSHRKRIPGKEGSKQSVKSSEGIEKPENFGNEKNIVKPEIQHRKVLDTVVEATHEMYGNTFHFALVIAAFLEPVPMHDYTLPFKFRVPRPLKAYDAKKSSIGQDSSRARKSNEIIKKSNDKRPKKSRDKKAIDDLAHEPIDSVVTNEEVLLMKKRQYILPLMEANEAFSVLEKYKESRTK